MPTIALPLGLLALAPFLVFGVGAASPFPETAERMLMALIDYAALILAFLGGAHWGMALTPGGARATVRFLLGVAPVVVAWVGLIVGQMIAPSVALTVLGLGYLAALLTEHRASRQLLTPPRTRWLRRAVSVVALVMMAMVLLLRGIGQTIVF